MFVVCCCTAYSRHRFINATAAQVQFIVVVVLVRTAGIYDGEVATYVSPSPASVYPLLRFELLGVTSSHEMPTSPKVHPPSLSTSTNYRGSSSSDSLGRDSSSGIRMAGQGCGTMRHPPELKHRHAASPEGGGGGGIANSHIAVTP